MPLHMICADITKLAVDAIVSDVDVCVSESGGTSSAIYQAAGPELWEAFRALGEWDLGSARITKGFDLPCRYVIHAGGPVLRSGVLREKAALAACYKSSLELALANGCKSIAFPLISSGENGYPGDIALSIATEAISGFLMNHSMQVYLVFPDKSALSISNKLIDSVREYISKHHHANDRCAMPFAMPAAMSKAAPSVLEGEDLDAMLSQIDESFSQMVQRKIRELGIKNSDCYKRANLDKKLFSKLINDPKYKPKKTTAVALAIALELSLSQTRELLMKAGYALSHSEKFDIIVEFFISKGEYNIFVINEVLFYYDQPLLGSILY